MSGALEAVIGAKYRLRPLKGRASRATRAVRRLTLEGASLSPFPYRLEAEDGRTFKLLLAGGGNRHAVRSLLLRYEVVSGLDFVPRVLWSDDRSILLEYVAGEIPDPAGADFSAAFGHNLARVHRLDADTLSAATVLRVADKHLEDLMDAGLLGRDTAGRIRDRLGRRMPGRMRTSADYADIQPANFRRGGDGRLMFVDLGGFHLGRLTGEGFLGHPGAAALDWRAFATGYSEAGGPPDMFERRDVIMALNDLRRGARLTIWADAMSVLHHRKREAFRHRATALAERLIRFANGTGRREATAADAAVAP